MRVFRLFGPVSLAFALPFSGAAVVQAQTVQPLNPLGDQLAAEMRLLAANPLDINALVRAGELALKLGDTTAAATFFARAERLDPRNARIKAGMGSLLVQAERPGEALRRFGEAETLGLAPRNYAADRGLAYDLIGQQERAQRDYRLALKDGLADETVRRYALSLGISGKRDMALQQLDPLLRRSDRGAWRARAFILAMNGDDQGASRIATNMMPPGLAQGLQPFFERLPSLGPTDRAFAVHFGELRATPERIADARLAPALAPLPPEPGMPVATVATVQAPPPRPAKQDDRRSRRKTRGQPDTVQVATTPPPQPQPQPLPQPPTYVASANSTAQPVYTAPTRAPDTTRQSMTLMPAPERQGVTAVPPRTPSSALASTIGAQGRGPAGGPVQQPASRPASPAPSTSSPVAPASSPLAGVPRGAMATPAAGGNPSPGAVGPTISGASPQPSTGPVAAPPPATGPVVAAPAPEAGPPDEPASTPSVAAPPSESSRAADIASAPPPASAPTPVRSEDSILASIIANIAVPGSELDVAPVETARAAAPPVAPARVAPQPVDSAAAAREAAEKQALADKKALVDRKAAEAKKLADAKKLAEAKKAAELKKKNDPKILEPARIWVQVAGGANEATLPKEWEKVRSRAPAAFKGKSGWTTPLRATNRVLVGPFKTNEEARVFVNALAKEGISAFTFTSEAGQKVAKLAAK